MCSHVRIKAVSRHLDRFANGSRMYTYGLGKLTNNYVASTGRSFETKPLSLKVVSDANKRFLLPQNDAKLQNCRASGKLQVCHSMSIDNLQTENPKVTLKFNDIAARMKMKYHQQQIRCLISKFFSTADASSDA